MRSAKKHRLITTRATKLFAIAITSLFFYCLVLPAYAFESDPATIDAQPAAQVEVSPVTDNNAAPEAPAQDVAASQPQENATPEVNNNPTPDKIPQQSLMQSGGVSAYSFLEPKNRLFLPNANLSSGSLSENIQIIVPPGRNGMQPDLKLQYDSQNTDNGNEFGYGWSINIPYIQKINRFGVDKLYDGSTSTFYSSLSDELVSLDGVNYRAKTESGDLLKYTFATNTWTVVDKKGTIYRFGIDTSSQQFDATSTGHIYKWMLQEVRDTNDNYIKYQYFKDNGQIYPSNISYTGNGIIDGIYSVSFLREGRADTSTLFSTGFSVFTNYRINEIDVKINGTWEKKYLLGYGLGDNDYRSLLTSIVEQGQDETGNVIIKPTTTFGYTTSTQSFTNDGSWQASPVSLSQSGVLVGDVNGDGLQDLVQSYRDDPNNILLQKTYLNTGNKSWATSTDFIPPRDFYNARTNPYDQGSRFTDFNGDGRDDIIGSTKSGSGKWALMASSTGWVSSTYDWRPPGNMYITDDQTGQDTGVRLVDINGDGMMDIIRLSPYTYNAMLNNGQGYTGIGQWGLNMTSTESGMIFADVNGDGLVDLVQGSSSDIYGHYIQKIYINTGNTTTGWVYDQAYSQPVQIINSFAAWDQLVDLGIRVADMNGDGLPDLLAASGAFINNGKGYFVFNQNYKSFQFYGFSDPLYDLGVQVVDINGDGMPDILHVGPRGFDPRIMVDDKYINNTTIRSDLLNSIKLSTGATSTISYLPSTAYRNGQNLANPYLPSVIDTVSQIITNDGLGNFSSSSYSYAGGELYFDLYNPYNRKPVGFNKVTSTDSVGNNTVNYYHQGDTSDSSRGEYNDSIYKVGKPYRTEVRDSNNNLFAATINKWDESDLGNSSHLVDLAQRVDFVYDGQGAHRDTAESYTYSTTTGNITQKIAWGEVTASDDGTFSDTGNDKFTTNYSYAINTSSSIIGLESQETLTDQNSNKVKEDKYYYDTQSLGTVTKGNETKHEYWKVTSTYANTQKTYNTYGLVTQITDALGKISSSTYDTYNLFPATSTNVMNQSQKYLYDYSNGKPKQIIDENNLTTQNIFDGLDRIIAVRKSDFQVTSTLVTTSLFAYTPQAVGTLLVQTDWLNATNTVSTYTYTDGFDRVLQSRKSAATANTYIVSDNIYNNLGQIGRQSLPYFSNGYTYNAPTTTNALFKNYSYDPLMRVSATADAMGTTTNAYDRWKTTITDPNGNVKNLYKDAYGNLVKVEEKNGANTYTTTYTYNGLGNLTNITDALSNVRNFTYDGLGRRLTAEDLHVSGDTTYGTSTFAYDDNGNLTQSVNANGQVVNFTYDNLNRVLSEDYTGMSGVEVQYAYDNCLFGVGKRCTVTTTNSVVATYGYDTFGNIKQTTSTISGVNYATKYTHDRQGHPLIITYPDNSQVQYTYNATGLAQTVSTKESTTSSFSTLVSALTYSPLGQIAQIQYANGATTTNTYDPNQLYRLTNKYTYVPDDGGLHGEGLRQGVIMPVTSSYWWTPGVPYEPRSTWVNGKSQTQSMLFNDGFEAEYLWYWFVDGNGSQDCTVAYNGNCSQKLVVSTAGQIWDTLLGQRFRIENNKTYTIKFHAKASTSTTITIGVGQDHDPFDNLGLFKQVAVSTTWKSYSYTFTGYSTDEAAGVFFYVGANTSTYWIDDVELIPEPLNKLSNSSFENAYLMDYWDVYSPGGNAQATSSIDCTTASEGKCSVKIKILRGSDIDLATLNEQLALTTSTYVLTFDAKASSTVNEYVSMSQNHDPWTEYSWNQFNVSSTWKSYSMDIALSGGDPTARFSFNFAPNTNTIWLDNIHLWPKQMTKVTSSPVFSALYESSVTSTAASYEIQVIPDGASWSAPLWDSGKQTLASSTPQGIRTPNISYAGPVLPLDGKRYLWRIKFWDNNNNEGLYSNGRDYFMMQGKDVQNISYSYDKVGNITSITDSSDTDVAKATTFAYDTLNRLTNATATNAVNGNNYTQTYSYDALGNLTNKSDQGSYSYAGNSGNNYANPDAVTSIGSNNFTYDRNGNLLTQSGVATNTWDYRNQLATSSISGQNITYTYDQDGNRVTYKNAVTTTVYVGNLYSTDGITPTKQIYVNGILVASDKGVGAQAKVYDVHNDQISSSNILSDGSSGKIVEVMDYYPFGSIRLDEQGTSFVETKKFTGHEYDMDTGLNYFGARYQDGSRGQFLSQDQAFLSIGDSSRIKAITGRDLSQVLSDPQSLNSYAYARNNPLRLTDPNGQWFGEFLTGRQSWSSFQGELGEAAMYLSDTSPVWKAAMDHPYAAGAAIGVAGGAGAAAGAAAATAVSAAYLGGAGTACIAFCDKATQISNGATNAVSNISRLTDLPIRPTAITKLDSLSEQFGMSQSEILKQASQSSQRFVDNSTGNINIWISKPNGADGFIRVTTNPQLNAVISAGQNRAAQVINGIANGRFTPLK